MANMFFAYRHCYFCRSMGIWKPQQVLRFLWALRLHLIQQNLTCQHRGRMNGCNSCFFTKQLPTNITRQWFLLVMIQLVSFQTIPCSERRHTVWTFMRLNSCMCSFVFPETSFISERLPTHIAWMRSYTCMHGHMSLHVGGCCEQFTALWTCVWFLSCQAW